MPRDTFNLAIDIIAVRSRLTAMPYAGAEMAQEILAFLGTREPIGLAASAGACGRCHECCRSSWWRRHVLASRRYALDPLGKQCYKLGDHHEILEGSGEGGDWVVLDGALSDPSVSLWSEITHHGGKLYVRDIRYIDYEFHPRDLSVWEIDPITCEKVLEVKTESEVTCFDVFCRDRSLLVAYVSPLHPAELRVDYRCIDREGLKSRVIEDYTARCFHVPMFSEAVRFVNDNLICVGHSDGCLLGITLIDVSLDGPGEVLSTVHVDCSPGDFVSGIEISPCGHVVYVGISSPSYELTTSREVLVVY
ncbi:hypothetical protein FOL47_009324 [Perkinsus chesapeaki]|uniref:Uncharacterized protein n=1 Tax=Perkinsus chesapeaki TaxID=330153 RepID=A0A7J6L932_PERCH|nr:hypothetical protein FOL47_009324 [Perkinsus chesapeaki]